MSSVRDSRKSPPYENRVGWGTLKSDRRGNEDEV
jgi:hypothetical protein